jgi:hypothetical protein
MDVLSVSRKAGIDVRVAKIVPEGEFVALVGFVGLVAVVLVCNSSWKGDRKMEKSAGCMIIHNVAIWGKD